MSLEYYYGMRNEVINSSVYTPQYYVYLKMSTVGEPWISLWYNVINTSVYILYVYVIPFLFTWIDFVCYNEEEATCF